MKPHMCRASPTQIAWEYLSFCLRALDQMIALERTKSGIRRILVYVFVFEIETEFLDY